ncbi:MAG: class B sortase [Clostridium sp.]|nr:class B sortase [Acetatifactor muris]MCM1525841.1 class B sortase [Bacteroides sp.]MCM1562619.1 class B sortase [Clostridium sp.]
MRIKIYVLSGIAAVICVAAAISLLVYQRSADQLAEDRLEEMRRQAQERTEAPAESSAESSEPADETVSSPEIPEETASEPAPVLTDNPYRDSFLANEDMAAWLKIEGTNIDYPVMWTPRDENYYLLRNFQGQSDQNGCLILDTDSCLNPLTTNQIIHGHNMRSGAMFGNLTDYEDENYCEEHNIITLYTEECERRYEVIAVFRSQVYKKTDQVFKFYKFFQADTPEEFDDFYKNIKDLSLYDTGVTAEFGDYFITLSTCAYHVEMGRFVVVAKEIESGDQYAAFRETSALPEQNHTN